MSNTSLLSRDEFREAVFSRDGYKCVICGKPAQDAHHIMERKLFVDGGYYVDNGASVCGECHLACESTLISTEQLREAAKISTVILPPHLYPDAHYDKWGSLVLEGGKRIPGELHSDGNTQKALAPVIHLFEDKYKYPRTYHLPWSNPGRGDRVHASYPSSDDKVEVVVTLKLDGENTTLYPYREGVPLNERIHARALSYTGHPSRNKMKAFHADVAHHIDPEHRLVIENCDAVHSIAYDWLPNLFWLTSVWWRDICLSWDDVETWSQVLEIPTAPVLYRGQLSQVDVGTLITDYGQNEGYVIRPTAAFTLREFRSAVGKYVRPNHVNCDHHWSQTYIPQKIVNPNRDTREAKLFGYG